MRNSLFHVERMEMTTLQTQIREMLVSAMLSGQLPAGAPIPSTRAMAKRLKVSRNTVMLAYQALASDGYLIARERSGFYVSPDIHDGTMAGVPPLKSADERDAGEPEPEWDGRFRVQPSEQANIEKPSNWHDYPYPFIYGQADAALFPIAAWRDCMRQSMGRKWLDAWTNDHFAEDDRTLIEQIRQRVLTRRGILANPDEILVTLGAQNALYILSSLLVKRGTTVAIENPGYPDIRNIFRLRTSNIRHVPVDSEGITLGPELQGSELVFVTPSHQYPTNATMSMERRKALLEWANRTNSLIIEDDYEFETNYEGEPTPALKSLDHGRRVLYVGSLSKSLMPGLRMGFMVAPAALIREARALRRLMLRHPPGNNQGVVALFLALGHHDTLIGRLHRSYRNRWITMGKALEKHFPGWAEAPGFGGTSYWIKGPDWLDCSLLASRALEEGIVIEPGDIYFADPGQHRNYFRLGFSSIAEERIEPGIERLAEIVRTMAGG
jgi:GntR family transcriptional regulator/MocR family aminotransferase